MNEPRTRRHLNLESLESRSLLAAIPTASLVTPVGPLIGEQATFQVGFQNTSPNVTGYSPFIDLTLPATGDDGNDGITFQSATYLGTPLAATVLVFNSQGEALHPLAKNTDGSPVVIHGTPGDQLVVLALPFGSFTPGQPQAIVDVTTNVSSLATVGTALAAQAQGGFALGNDPLDDPATDPSILGPTVDGTTTPELLRLTKTYLGPEDETATGPSFPHQYLISVEVATGQTVTDLDLSDLLPNNLQFMSVVDTLVHGVSYPTTAISTPSTTLPGGTLTRQFDSVTGNGSSSDASMLFDFYIPQLDASSNPVLTPDVGTPVTSVDTANSQANWTPLNPSDPPGIFTSNPATDTLTDKALAIQKTVQDVIHTGPANAVSPGDTLEYTIQFQVSDFFALQNFIVNDLLSDGQAIDTGFAPTLEFNGNGSSSPVGAFLSPNVSVVPQVDGSTTVAFNVSNELLDRGLSGLLIGGMVNPSGGMLPFPGNGPTTGTITFRTVIQKTFTETPSPGAVVGQGDKISDHVTGTATVLNNETLQPTVNSISDDSQAQEVISAGTLSKSVYEINGVAPVGANPTIKPGDDVTYELKYTLPNSNFNDLILQDYLPLPIFDATTITTFDPTVSAAAPAVGVAKFGPSDTFFALSGLTPTLSVNSVSNFVQFEWPAFLNQQGNSTREVDLLFTVQVSSLPFSDQLLLTNQAQSIETTANNSPIISTQIAQVVLTEPALSILKGVVATNDSQAQFTAPVGPVTFNPPGSSTVFTSPITSNGIDSVPINANLVQAQGSDLVTFAITVENTGTGPNGAFDVTISDTIPSGFRIPTAGAGLNLHVTDGNGTPLGVVPGGDLFGSGIELVDPSATQGALTQYSPTSGTNIAIITYDLQVSPTVIVGTTQVNTATLSNYASVPGGPDFVPAGLTDTAFVGIKGDSVVKALTATNQPFTTGNDLAIGEIGTYTVTISVAQGLTPSGMLVDTLPNGLAIVSLDSLTTNSPGLLTFGNGTLASILNDAQTNGIGTNGSSATFNFGDIQNNDDVPTDVNTITAVYEVVALNVAANTNHRIQANSAKFSYNDTSTTASANARIVVPHMQVTKSVNNPTADAGTIVTYTMTIKHASDTGADAFNVSMSDVVPAGVTYVPGSLAYLSNGLTPTTYGYDSGTNSIFATYDSFTTTQFSTLTFQAVVVNNIQAFQTVTNTATIQYTTLPGSPGQISPYNPNSVERTGNPSDPGGAANNLIASGSASFTPTPTIAKVLLGTDQPFTTGNSVAIGETAQYQVTITIPRGVSQAATLSDTLPDGLALVSFDSITATAGLTTSLGSFDNVFSDALVQDSGHLFTLGLGNVTNPPSSSTAQTITIDYTAVTLNVASNQSGATLTNDAIFQTGTGQASVSAAPLTVVTPRLTLTKSASPTSGDSGGAPITFTLTLAHDSTSTTDAFNILLTDPLPAGLTYVPGTLHGTAGLLPTTLEISGGVINATFASFPLGSTSTIVFQAKLANSTTPGQTVTNVASTQYTTLPGNVLTPISPYNPVSTERTGNQADPGGSVNDLATSDFANVTVYSNSLAGTVFVDPNNNGILEPGDPRLSDVLLTLTGTDNLGDSVTTTTTTNGSGQYAFNGLRPGNYEITKTQPTGYLSGINTIGTQGGTAPPPPSDLLTDIVLPLGTATNGVSNNFAEIVPSMLSGSVFVDYNEDGIRVPSDPGIPGVTIELTGTNDLGPVAIFVTTDASGDYVFPDLRPGSYTITETQPAGFATTINTIGTQGGTVEPNDVLGNITIGQGVDGMTNNFGERYASTLSGFVYVDLNNNGHKDPGENGIGGVQVTLNGIDNFNDPVHLVTTTAANGSYAFTELRAGSYTITETQPAGYFSGINSIGSQGGYAAPPISDVLSSIVLPVGVSTNGINNDFAELPPASLSGCVYWDVNHNGIEDSPDYGIVDVTITLTGVDDLGDQIREVTQTAANGTYSFNSLRPGVYTITETHPNHFRDYMDNVGSLGGVVTNDQFSQIVVKPGDQGTDYCFGELQERKCRLRSLALQVGDLVAQDLASMSKNPTAFRAKNPQVASLLSAGIVPRGIGRYPQGPLAYQLVPLLGTKHLTTFFNTKTHRTDLRGTPNFPSTQMS